MKTSACDLLVNLYQKDIWYIGNNRIVKAFISDLIRITDFSYFEFPSNPGWRLEIERAVINDKCFIALDEHNDISGFACYDTTAKGYFGPLGVKKDKRLHGIGRNLVYACFDSMKQIGYGYAIIGWVGEQSLLFYQKIANVLEIPDSSPEKTIYKRKIMYN